MVGHRLASQGIGNEAIDHPTSRRPLREPFLHASVHARRMALPFLPSESPVWSTFSLWREVSEILFERKRSGGATVATKADAVP